MRLQTLTHEEKTKIHDAALEVLERTGILVFHKESVNILTSAGASVTNGTLVKIPSFLVQEALRSAPPRVTIYDREGEPRLYLYDDHYYFFSSPGCLNLIDSLNGNRRAITYDDMCNYAKVVDSLSDIDLIGSWMMTYSPAALADRYQAEAILLNTSKPFYLAPLSIEGLKDILSMCSVIAGGAAELSKRPFFITAANPIPPLRIPELSCQKLLLMSERRLPLVFNPMILAGATGPIDLFGSLVLLMANNLAELVLSQLKSRGTPIILGGVGAVMDMRTAQMSYGGPEFNLLCSGLAEMGHFYSLPVWGTGGCSSSKVLDAQAALEATSSIIFSVLTGAHLIHDVGFLEDGLTSSFEMQFLCNEIISMIRKTTTGIHLSDAHRTPDLIERVGTSGNYLTEPETIEHFREVWFPSFLDRRTYQAWFNAGGLTMEKRLNLKVQETLKDYRPKELKPETINEIKRIVENAGHRHP